MMKLKEIIQKRIKNNITQNKHNPFMTNFSKPSKLNKTLDTHKNNRIIERTSNISIENSSQQSNKEDQKPKKPNPFSSNNSLLKYSKNSMISNINSSKK